MHGDLPVIDPRLKEGCEEAHERIANHADGIIGFAFIEAIDGQAVKIDKRAGRFVITRDHHLFSKEKGFTVHYKDNEGVPNIKVKLGKFD